MTNIFSTFDPSSRFSLIGNWVVTILVIGTVPAYYWTVKSPILKIINSLLMFLHQEYKINFSITPSPGHTHWAITLFIFILINNLWGLTPYTFTRSSHLTFALTLGLTFWASYVTISFLKDTTHSLAHLVPVGTPTVLLPVMVIIETVSNLIRPITLSVRLVANLVAGHLLITLTASPLSPSIMNLIRLIIIPLIILIILESAVALIQAYVFSMLRTLYLREVNYTSVNS